MVGEIVIKLCKRPSAKPFYTGVLFPAPENCASLLDAALAHFDAFMRTNVYAAPPFARVAVTVTLGEARVTLARMCSKEFMLTKGGGARIEAREVDVVVTALQEDDALHALGGGVAAALERHTEALRHWVGPEGRVAIATFAHRCVGEDADIAAALLRDTVALFRTALARPLEKAEMAHVSKNARRFFGDIESFKMVDAFLPTWVDGAAPACGKVPFFARLASRLDHDPNSRSALAREVHRTACMKFEILLNNLATMLEKGLHRRTVDPGGEKGPSPPTGAQGDGEVADPLKAKGATGAALGPEGAGEDAREGAGEGAREDLCRTPDELAGVEAAIAEATRTPCQSAVGRLLDALLGAHDARVVFLGDVAMLDEDIKLVRADVFAQDESWLPRFLERVDPALDIARSRPHGLVERVFVEGGGRTVAIVSVFAAARAPLRLLRKTTAHLRCAAPFLLTESRDRIVARCVADMLCLAHECHGPARKEKLVEIRLLYRALRLFCERSRLKITVKGRRRAKIFFSDFDRRLCTGEGGTAPNALRDIPYSGKMADGAVLCDLKHPDAVNTFAHGPVWEKLVLLA